MALIESGTEPVAYAVWREDEDGVYLRQFFAVRGQRRAGAGSRAFGLLERDWKAPDVTLDVMLHNERGLAFWRSLGFRDYATVLRRQARD